MPEMLDFILYPLDEHDEEHIAVAEHVSAGRLPFDIMFRLAGIGFNQRDPEDDRCRLQWSLLKDLIEHANEWSMLRADSRAILEGPRPDMIVDICRQPGKPYSQLDPMYYRIGDLALGVREFRAERGKTVTELPPHSYHFSVQDYENRLCVGLARPLWRTIIQRTRPQWLKEPEKYYPDCTYSWMTRYELSPNTVRRRMIGATVISDAVIHDIYQEAVRTGVRNIGPHGQESLRRLLEDEHLELSHDARAVPVDS